MIKGTTQSGFKFSINEKYLDWELFEMMSEIDKNPLALVDLSKRLLGIKQYKRLKDHCRTEEGQVPFEKMESEILAILNSNQKTKN